MFECSGLRGALLRIGRLKRVPSPERFRSRPRRKTKEDRCRISRRRDSSEGDARARPIGGGRARRFHPNPRSDQSSYVPEPSRVGRKAIGTT